MILDDGRAYSFYHWETKYALMEPYNYIDVSISDYLERLKKVVICAQYVLQSDNQNNYDSYLILKIKRNIWQQNMQKNV